MNCVLLTQQFQQIRGLLEHIKQEIILFISFYNYLKLNNNYNYYNYTLNVVMSEIFFNCEKSDIIN